MVIALCYKSTMAIKTYSEQLETVQTAIERIELYGQATTFSGGVSQQLTEADLNALYKREERLRAAVSRESSGGMRIRRGVAIS